MYIVTKNQMNSLKLAAEDIYVTNAGYNKWEKEMIIRILKEIEKQVQKEDE